MKPEDATHETQIGLDWVPCVIVTQLATRVVVRVLQRDRGKMVDDGNGYLVKRRPHQIRRRNADRG